MDNEKIESRIFQLLEIKDFEALSDDERNMVLSDISQKEYNSLRKTIQSLHNTFETESIKESEDLMKIQLMTALDKKADKRKITSLTIPLLYAAAGVLLAVGLSFLFVISGTGQLEKSKSIVTTILDTVYIETTDTVWLTQKQSQISQKSKPQNKVNSGMNHPVSKFSSIEEIIIASNGNCESSICPDEVIKVNKLSSRNSIVFDEYLTKYIVAIP